MTSAERRSLLVRARDGAVSVTPESAGWRYVTFSVVRVARGGRHVVSTQRSETCVVMLAGRCSVRGDASFDGVGDRASPFDGPPHAVYAPPGATLELCAVDGDLDIAIGSAPATKGAMLRHIAPREVRRETRGRGAMERTIHHILMEDAAAETLLVTEVITPAAHWSSYPPHKHDANDPPRETQLEETYYHRLRDPRGFAVQRVYTADRSLDETIAVRDGDLVLVPRGYHTVSAAPGYELYYLNVMAGPVRRWCVTFDPDHDWLRR
jgi:5-deoxy-glucuronate isomerase